jgi:hypothetical protein
MNRSGNNLKPSIATSAPECQSSVHPSWAAFMRFCRELSHGEIENLRIQDGLPLSAETIRRKIRFTS